MNRPTVILFRAVIGDAQYPYLLSYTIDRGDAHVSRFSERSPTGTPMQRDTRLILHYNWLEDARSGQNIQLAL